MGNRYYVVTVGRKPGVYTSWEDTAPQVLGVPKSVYKGYDSETEAFTAYGRATMAGEKRILGADDSDETPSQPTARVKKPEMRPQTTNANNNTKAVTKEDDFLEEIVTQCPPVSSSRLRSTIQRASTLPHQQPHNSSNNPIQRSKTAPNLDSHPTPSVPKKSVRGQKLPASNVSRSRAISISTNGCTTDEETIPSSPATDVSCTLSPTFGHRFPSSPHKITPSSPVRPGHRGDGDQTRHRRCRSGGYENQHNHQTPIARSVRGNKSPAHIISASSSKKAAITSEATVQSTRPGIGHRHRPAKVVWGSSSTNKPPSIHRGTLDPTSHAPRDRSESRLPPSPSGSSQLTYVSDDQRPAAALTHLTGGSDYYTPSSRNSEMSDNDSEQPRRVPSSTSKRNGKRRASPPPSSSQNQGSPVKESSSPSPSLTTDSSPQNLNSGPSHKRRRGRNSRPPSPRNGVDCQEQTQPQSHGQSLGQDVCHCAGPCPSCHKPRLPSPQVHPFMFQPGYYPYFYFPPPNMPNPYHLTHYGPSPHPYPYAIPLQTDPIPSISSAQPLPPPSGYPMPPALATHHPTAYPNLPTHVSPAPSTPAPAPSIYAPISSPFPVGSPPVDYPATKQVSPELLEALDQFYQPPQRSVKVIDPSCDPRSPYSGGATVPALLNSPIVLGRPGTPLSPLKGLGFAL